MDEFNASEFKSKCLAILDLIARTGRPVRIKKRGKPVAILYPDLSGGEGLYAQDLLKGSVQTKGNLFDPAVAAKDWEAQS